MALGLHLGFTPAQQVCPYIHVKQIITDFKTLIQMALGLPLGFTPAQQVCPYMLNKLAQNLIL